MSAGTGNVFEYTPGGVQSTFASGLGNLGGIEFDTAGNLFVDDASNKAIYKITPGGVVTTFASGFVEPSDLAIQPVPEPSALAFLALGAAALAVRRR